MLFRSSTFGSGGGFASFGSGSKASTLSYLGEPPNLTNISDANVVVAFKNLLKKDSTTKTKGLEDLRSYVQAHPYDADGGVEQPILEAWVGYWCPLLFLSTVVIDNPGQTISPNFDRQLKTRPRAGAFATMGLAEVGAQAHGKVYTKRCGTMAGWYIRQR